MKDRKLRKTPTQTGNSQPLTGQRHAAWRLLGKCRTMTGTRSTIHLLLCCCMLVVSAYAPTSPSVSASAGSACSACLQDGVKEALRVAWTTMETGQKASNIVLRWHSFRCRHHDCMFNNTSCHPSTSRNFHRARMRAFSLHILACLSRAQHTQQSEASSLALVERYSKISSSTARRRSVRKRPTSPTRSDSRVLSDLELPASLSVWRSPCRATCATSF